MSPEGLPEGRMEAAASEHTETSDKILPLYAARANIDERDPLLLPRIEPWPTPINGAGLLDWIRDEVRRYVVIPPHVADTVALWTLHTYAFHLRSITTYLGIVSPEPRCGKTTLVRLLGLMANRAVLSSNISPPAVFRAIEAAQPTLLIDEGDTFLKRKEELRGILNAGYTRETAYVIRVASQARNAERRMRTAERSTSNAQLSTFKETSSGLVKFSCWCPKAISAIGRLPEVLADRCIVIMMQRKTSSEHCERLRNPGMTELRRKCARFVEDQAERIRDGQPEIPASLNDRAADIWEPLLSLADLAGGEWPQRARLAAEKLSGSREELSPIGKILAQIRLLFETSQSDRMFTRTMVEALNQLEEIAELRHGKAISEVWLSRQLADYGIASRTIWIGEECAKGYHLEDFKEVFERYGHF